MSELLIRRVTGTLLWGCFGNPSGNFLLETHCILRSVVPVEGLQTLEPLLALQAVSLVVFNMRGAGKSQGALLILEERCEDDGGLPCC